MRQRAGRTHIIDREKAAADGSSLHALLVRFAHARGRRRAKKVCDRCYTAARRAHGNNEPVVVPSLLGARVGLGIFAQRAFRRGERITLYGGRLMSTEESRALPVQTHTRNIMRGVQDLDGTSGYRSARKSLAAGATHHFGLASLVNTLMPGDKVVVNVTGGHADESTSKRVINARFKRIECRREASMRVVLVATRPIAVGDEFYASYGRDYQVMASRQQRGNNAMAWPTIAKQAENFVGGRSRAKRVRKTIDRWGF